MDDAARVNIVTVLAVSVDTDNGEVVMVEPIRTRVDAESEFIVLPARVENVILVACNVLVISVERTLS
jgi:hypothetical protein